VSQWQLLTGENEDNQGFNGGDDKQKKTTYMKAWSEESSP
jgi:hypothetical protein